MILVRFQIANYGLLVLRSIGPKDRNKENQILVGGVTFGNSDVEMIKVFIQWLDLMNVQESGYYFELYVHESRKSEVLMFKKWWANQLGVSTKKMDRVYLKKGNIKTNRKNIADLYHGLIRIKVNSSTTLNRQINGWVYGIVASLGGRLMVGQLPLKQ